jgi:hypothetical protein
MVVGDKPTLDTTIAHGSHRWFRVTVMTIINEENETTSNTPQRPEH